MSFHPYAKRSLPSMSLLILLIFWGTATSGLSSQEIPKQGDQAPEFTLKDHGGEAVELKKLREKGPVIVLFLRGYPGYQCPLCTKQVADFRKHSEAFAQEKATILLIYPGPAEKLEQHATEFLPARELPPNLRFVTDPDYQVTMLWKLRWDAPKETAYPSTFIVDPSGKIRFAQVSRSHGGRTKADQILEKVRQLSSKK